MTPQTNSEIMDLQKKINSLSGEIKDLKHQFETIKKSQITKAKEYYRCVYCGPVCICPKNQPKETSSKFMKAFNWLSRNSVILPNKPTFKEEYILLSKDHLRI